MLNFPALDFHLGETIGMLRESVQDFAAAEIAPARQTHPDGQGARPTEKVQQTE